MRPATWQAALPFLRPAAEAAVTAPIRGRSPLRKVKIPLARRWDLR